VKEILNARPQGILRHGPQDHLEQLATAVIEGGDGQSLAAESVMQPTVLPSVDIAREWPSVVADLSGKRTAVARLHGVDTEEGDSTVKLSLDPHESGPLSAARRAPRREEVHNQGPATEVGQTDVSATTEAGQVEVRRVGGGRRSSA
jgi:hypothetical protein